MLAEKFTVQIFFCPASNLEWYVSLLELFGDTANQGAVDE